MSFLSCCFCCCSSTRSYQGDEQQTKVSENTKLKTPSLPRPQNPLVRDNAGSASANRGITKHYQTTKKANEEPDEWVAETVIKTYAVVMAANIASSSLGKGRKSTSSEDYSSDS